MGANNSTAKVEELRFDNRVAIVTGSGRGLGRTHALLLASRGAKVVINDYNPSAKGETDPNAGPNPADQVVEEIKKAGGEAVANYDSVTDGHKIVETAIKAFGRVDIVINNAGILRDRMFSNMTEKDWDMVMAVHVKGAFAVTKAAWPHMKKQNYGRIVSTCSAAGLYGNAGQANYSAAKLALLGFTRTLAIEGARNNIQANCIAPIATSRMTEKLLPSVIQQSLLPENVAPVVAYLVHESCQDTGEVFECGGGWIAKLRWQRTSGAYVPAKSGEAFMSPESVAEKWTAITDFKSHSHPTVIKGSITEMMKAKAMGKLRSLL